MKNKFLLFSVALFVVFSVVIIAGLKHLHRDKKELIKLRSQQKEVAEMKNKIFYLNQKMSFYESRKITGKAAGIIQISNEIFSSMGLKNKLKNIKTSNINQTINGLEETSEISFEKVSMNELLNILYGIENSPHLLSLKRIAIKKDFENPQLLNLNMVVSYIRQK